MRQTLALGCVLAGLPGVAQGSQSGGSYASDPARIEALTCRSTCLDEDTARPGSVVRIVGRDMHRVRKATFLGGRGEGDDRTVPVLRWAKRIADVRVPDGAPSGRVRVRNGDGAPSRPSAETLAVGTADPEEAAGAPGAPDRDTSDRIDAHVESSMVLFAGLRSATLRFTVVGDGPLEVAVELVRLRDGAPVARWAPGAVEPGAERRIDWDGTVDGRVAPEGRYEFRVSPVAAAAAQSGEPALVSDAFRFLDHRFPVRGRHDFGSEIARFGAPRSGHLHQGHDVFAACGTPLVAARGGVVRWKAFHVRAGNYVVVDGEGTGNDYVYMHLAQPAIPDRGDRVATGQRLGSVGDTGAASGCHLHFELWSAPGWQEGGRPLDPLQPLRAWAAASRAPAR